MQTGKDIYPTRKAATLALKAIRERRGGQEGVLRCGWCDRYHLGRPRGRGGGRA